MPLSIENESFGDAWYYLLYDLIRDGDGNLARGLPTRELLGVSVKVTNARNCILDHPRRNLNFKFMVAEWLWIVSGSNNLEDIARYNSKLREFSDDGSTLAGAYGPRLIPQLLWALTALHNDGDSRQVVMSIWTPNPAPSKDIPCTLGIQLFIRKAALHGIVTMRSSDVWLGLPYDFFCFAQLLACFAGELGTRVGSLQFNLGSSHLYESNLVEAQGCLDDNTNCKTIVSPGAPEMPPRWLLVHLRDPSTKTIEMWRGLGEPWFTYAIILSSPKSRAYDLLKTYQPR